MTSTQPEKHRATAQGIHPSSPTSGPYVVSSRALPSSPVRIGVLGCGPIAQHAHLESTRKAFNAELYAICDVAPDLLQRMSEIHQPVKAFSNYELMLADSDLEAVVIATADEFHVPLAEKAVRAGKHVLVEKPMGVSVEECQALCSAVQRAGVVMHVGFMKRYDPGIQHAKDFVDREIGEVLAIRAWYCDSVYRYQMTDNLLPSPVSTRYAHKPDGNPKSDRRRYYMLAHGSHLVDLARFLGGAIVEVGGRFVQKGGMYSWSATVEFANGAVGQLDLTIPVAMDWHEGFTVYGTHGSVVARSYLPWYHRASDVDCIHAASGKAVRVVGADAHFYKRQIEGFAAAIRSQPAEYAATVEDGLAATRAMVAMALAAETRESVKLSEVTGAV